MITNSDKISAEHENPLLAAAIAYANRGIPTFPCHTAWAGRCSCGKPACEHPGKHPRTEHGVKDATTDPEQIRRWWQRWPDANIAIATGGASGIIALDVDPRHGGDVSLDMLEFEHGPLPATVVQHTPGGGRHYLFKHPGGTIKNSTSEVGPGLDIKADGGYILVEPSVGANGRPYVFEDGRRLGEVELAPLPAWLAARLQSKQNGHRTGTTEEAEPLREGQRNAVLFRLACSMRARGMSGAAILAALLAENEARCRPVLPEDEVQKIAASASKHEPGRTHAREKQPNGALTLTTLADLLNEPEEQVAWLVDKLLPAGGFSLLVAKPKAGKSTLARNLALAVAQGRDFLKRPVQHGAVIYLALEEKRSEVKKHFQAMGATGREEIYIYAAAAPADALQQIRAVVEEKKPVLLIIDPLFKLTRVKDSNDYAQVTAALEPLLILARETGTHVLCVHHAGKSERDGGDNILGSTAIFAAVDTALLMKRTERYRTLSSQQRYGDDLMETVLCFDKATGTLTLGGTREQEEEQRVAGAIVEFLEAKQAPAEEADIHEAVEGRKAIKVRALRRLLDEQKVCRQKKFPDKAGTRGNPYLYALEQCWFASSQDISGNQGTSIGKQHLSARKDSPNAGSRSFGKTDAGSLECASSGDLGSATAPADEETV